MPTLIEDEATWSVNIVEFLNGSLPLLEQYQDFEKRRYSEGKRPNWRERQALVNPNSTAHEQILSQLRCLLDDQWVLGCHCTRLTDDEIDLIRSDGLTPLSRDLCQTKLRRRVLAGDLTETQACQMLDRYDRLQDKKDGLREGRIWATLGRAALHDEDGLGPAFAWWGGEAMLESIAPPRHYSIGRGVIVEFRVKALASTISDMEKSFLNQFLFNRELADEDGVCDLCLKHPIPPSDILRVIVAGDREFESLTGSNSWLKHSPGPVESRLDR